MLEFKLHRDRKHFVSPDNPVAYWMNNNMHHQEELVVRLNLLGDFILLKKINILVKLKQNISTSLRYMYIYMSVQ